MRIIKKLKELFLENKILVVVFLALWAIVACLTLNNYKTSLGMKSYGNDNGVVTVYDIDKDTTITQMVNLEDKANSVCLKFATFARVNSGHVTIRVTGNNTNTLYLEESFDVSSIQDNAYKVFGLDEQIDNTKDEYITVTLTSDSNSEECVGIYYSPEKAFNLEAPCVINDQIMEGDISLRYLADSEIFANFNEELIIWIVIGITLLVVLLALKVKYEILFASIALVFGLIFMMVITPMSVPDEQTHYEYTYQLTNYILGQPHLMIDEAYQDYGDFAGHMNTSQAYKGFAEDFNKPLKLKNKFATMHTDVDDATYQLCYIPQVIGVMIGRLCKLNIYKTFYAGRLFNLLFYVACVYVGIKKTPIHKVLFGMISTMPMFIQQAASYSYDTFLNGLLLVTIAFLLKWYFSSEEINRREICEMIFVSLMMAPLKVVYSMFIFTFWFIPENKFGSKRKKTISLVLISAPVIYQVVLLFAPYVLKTVKKISDSMTSGVQNGKALAKAPGFKTLEPVSKEADPHVFDTPTVDIEPGKENKPYSFSYMLKNIPNTISIFYRTIRYNIKIWFYQSLGWVLSGASLVEPLRFAHIMSILLVIAAFVKEDFLTPINLRIVFVVISIAIGMFVLAGMLLTWTKRGDYYIQGIQGRYFSPLLFYCFTIFSNKFIKLPKKINTGLIFVHIIMVFEVVMFALSYTFVN